MIDIFKGWRSSASTNDFNLLLLRNHDFTDRVYFWRIIHSNHKHWWMILCISILSIFSHISVILAILPSSLYTLFKISQLLVYQFNDMSPWLIVREDYLLFSLIYVLKYFHDFTNFIEPMTCIFSKVAS